MQKQIAILRFDKYLHIGILTVIHDINKCMCGRYVTVTNTEVLEKTFRAKVQFDYQKNFNAAPSQLLPVITNEERKVIQGYHFGYLPPWAKSRFKGMINVKAESILKLGDNSTNYFNLVKGAVLNKRCVIPANCFIEWNRETKEPYVVYVQENRLVLFAGIHSTWLNPETGNEMNSFGIITQKGNKTMQTIGHDRQPLILPLNNYERWLNATSLAEVSEVLNWQLPDKIFNAYRVGNEIGNVRNTGKELIQPIGERLKPEFTYRTTESVELKKSGRRDHS